MRDARNKALRFVISIGIVSLFADMTYEGGRSIVGRYLAVLGAGPIFAGLVAGLGEFLGYSVRFLAGRYVDRTHRNWQVMGAGSTARREFPQLEPAHPEASQAAH